MYARNKILRDNRYFYYSPEDIHHTDAAAIALATALGYIDIFSHPPFLY